MAKFVTARCKGVLERIRVPENTLKYMPGWEAVPDGSAEPKRRSGRTSTSRSRQAEASAEADTNQPVTSSEGDPS